MVGSYAGASVSRVAIDGDYAYLGIEYGGLEILDISNPTAPQLVGHVRDGGGVPADRRLGRRPVRGLA